MAVLRSGDFSYEVSGEDWGTLPEGWKYLEVAGVAVDGNDNVYALTRGGHPVIVYDSDGNYLRSWGEGLFDFPHGISIGPDESVYCTDNVDHTVRKFTLDGKLLMTLGTKGRAAPLMSGEPFNGPTQAVADPRNGNIYVADGYGNARVHRYTPDGKYMSSWGEPGTGPGQFNTVHTIAIDADGWLYVADRENHKLQVFDTEGRFETQWNANMARPTGIHIEGGAEAKVYISEFFCGSPGDVMGTDLGPRVSIYGTNGDLKAQLGRQSPGGDAGQFFAPHAIAVDSRGDIYVAEVSWSEWGRRQDPPVELRSFQKLVRHH